MMNPQFKKKIRIAEHKTFPETKLRKSIYGSIIFFFPSPPKKMEKK